MSEYLSKKAVLEWLDDRRYKSPWIESFRDRLESGAFDAEQTCTQENPCPECLKKSVDGYKLIESELNTEVQRLRSLLERLDSYIDFSEHLSPGDWGIEDVTGINSLFDEVREALDGHDWAYVGKNPVQICRRCRKLWWQAEKICPGTKAPKGDENA